METYADPLLYGPYGSCSTASPSPKKEKEEKEEKEEKGEKKSITLRCHVVIDLEEIKKTNGKKGYLKCKFPIAIGGDTYLALFNMLFFQGLFSFAETTERDYIDITFFAEGHRDDISTPLDHIVRSSDLLRYFMHKAGKEIIQEVDIYILAIAIKFEDDEIFQLPINYDDESIREHFDLLSSWAGDFAQKYIDKVIEARTNGKKKHPKTKLIAVFKDPLSSQLWDNCDDDSRKAILDMVGFTPAKKGYAARVKATATENLAVIDREKRRDKYAAVFWDLIESDSSYAAVKSHCEVYGCLPSERNIENLRYGRLAGWYSSIIADYDAALSVEKRAFDKSTSIIDKKKRKGSRAQTDIGMIKAMYS